MAVRYCGEIIIKIRPDYNQRPTRYDCRLSTCGPVIVVVAPAAGYGPGIPDDSPETMDLVACAALSFADNFTRGASSDGADSAGLGWFVRRKQNPPVTAFR